MTIENTKGIGFKSTAVFSGSNRSAPHPPAGWMEVLQLLFSYRQKMPVTELMAFPDGNGYYVCPRCHATMEREFMAFCDRCGQHLDWREYRRAVIVYPGPQHPKHP